MMLHIDGSDHQWFQDERRHDLIVILDDATSEIYYAQLAVEETTSTVMAGLRAVIELKGLFCSLYSDRGAHFWLTPKSGGKVDYDRPTQVGRAMKELGVHMIPAYSPQARGRSERNFSTWQGRLPQELRLRGISSLEGANMFLSEHYIAEFNGRFMVPAAQRGTAFLSCRHRNLEMIFTQRYERTVDRDNTVRFQQPGDAAGARPLAPYHGRMQGDHPSASGHYPDPDDRRTSRRTLQRGRKTADAAEQKANQGRGKDVERKSPKADFPSKPANPANCAGFALSHRLYGY